MIFEDQRNDAWTRKGGKEKGKRKDGERLQEVKFHEQY